MVVTMCGQNDRGPVACAGAIRAQAFRLVKKGYVLLQVGLCAFAKAETLLFYSIQ